MRYQNNNKLIFIFSGIEPSKKGAGKFLAYFLKILKKYNNNTIKLHYIKTPDNLLISFLKRFQFFQQLKELYYTYKRNFSFQIETKDSTIIIFHPQSLGLKKTIDLIEKNNKVFIYVLDNFFFCKKSYNHLPDTYNSCYLCLYDVSQSINHNCSISPNNYSHSEYISFLAALTRNIYKITYLTQNDNQSVLLKEKFGNEIKIKKIGMFTGEFLLTDSKRHYDFRFDFLYHNTLSEAKGLKYFVELSKKMPVYKFAIPYSKKQVERITGKVTSTNISYQPCTWDNGLLELIIKSRITIVPSLWSAPIEGALIKSLFYSNTVALIPQPFSFADELPPDIYIKLHTNIEFAVKTLEFAIKNNISLNDKAKKFILTFIKSNIDFLEEFSMQLQKLP